ncbi:MAG: ribonuclease Z [Chitinophagaceae bacterium]|nr:ribonuclease Z [Chitinophagaceae bacterium]
MSLFFQQIIHTLFGLTILGNNSAVPAFGRHPTSQAVSYEDQVFLVDCGEGTQLQLARYKIRRSKINHIFISHLHGDHYFGLIGLLTSLGLMGREHDLTVYGPSLLENIIMMQLEAAGTQLKFKLNFVKLTEAGIIFSGTKMEVLCFPVKHRIPCFGFVFREKKLPRKLLPEEAKRLEIPANFFHHLQLGEDYHSPGGILIKNERVTTANTPGRIYAYSADTIYDESLSSIFANANLLYHESTYLHEMEDRARERFHTTARQAAAIAAKSGVKKLLLGHFSSKYETLDPFLHEATAFFPNTDLAIEGVTYRII